MYMFDLKPDIRTCSGIRFHGKHPAIMSKVLQTCQIVRVRHVGHMVTLLLHPFNFPAIFFFFKSIPGVPDHVVPEHHSLRLHVSLHFCLQLQIKVPLNTNIGCHITGILVIFSMTKKLSFLGCRSYMRRI